MIGILGGMGPAATVDLMAKIVRLTKAARDQDHLPLVVMSDPRVPDRVAPILEGREPSPAPAMIRGAEALRRAGAECLAIPCHTAHYWATEITAATGLPIIHVVDAVLTELARRQIAEGPVGLLATAATLKADLYQSRLGRAGYPCVLPGDDLMARTVLPAIAAVKKDRISEAVPLLLEAVHGLKARGVGPVVLACTELPVAMAAARGAGQHCLGDHCLDATEALARACLEWYRRSIPAGPRR